MEIGFIARPKQPLGEEDVRFAAEHGFRTLELIWDDFTAEHYARRGAEKALLRAHGVRLSAVGLWRRNPIHPDPAARARCLEDLERLIAYCGELEAPVAVCSGGTLLGPEVEACAAECARVMAPVLERAKRAGVRVAFYGVHGQAFTEPNTSFLRDLPAYERLWRDLPGAGMKFDAANWLHRGLDPLAPLRHHGPRIFHVHIKDHLYHNGTLAAQPPAGMGDVPFPKVLAFLHEHRYAGSLSIEPHGPWQKDPELRRRMLLLSKRYLEGWVL